MNKCRNCDGDTRGVYCNQTCQWDYQINQKIKIWLETGVAVAHSSKGHYVREYIFKEQNGKCAICDCSSVWMEKELVFILDHIDGNSENNRRENLRLVCPNCDSQLDTYKSRNKGNGRFNRRQRYAAGKSA